MPPRIRSRAVRARGWPEGATGPGAVATAPRSRSSRVARQDARTPRVRDEPLAHGLAPGKYSITGHYAPKEGFDLRVGDHRGDEALESLRQFFLGADTSIEAFWGHHFVGINYPEAMRLRDAGYRLWCGELDSPPWELIVAP